MRLPETRLSLIRRDPESMPGILLPHVALPRQHGSWALWLAPYVIGVAVGGRPGPALIWLTVALLGGFLAIQPLTVLVKILAGRRSASDRASACFWLGVWLVTALAGAAGMTIAGHGRILWLVPPALAVLAWQMWLVGIHAERRQRGAEIASAGVLALAAPSACLVTGGSAETAGWLWLLCWLQAAGSIVYVYLRLEQRHSRSTLPWRTRLRQSAAAVFCHLVSLAVVITLAALRRVPEGTIMPFCVLLVEAAYGGWVSPATGLRPTSIGMRQVFVHALFAALMISAYSVD